MLLSFAVNSQFSNDWIDFDQDYYKFPVAEDGIYRIPFSSLSGSGIPVGSIDAAHYQLYRMGEQVPVYVTRDFGILQASDFIEFYGRKNRGELDRELYEDPDADQLNPEYSLFNDTIHYFLTWGEEPGMRIEAVENDLENLPEKEEFYMHRELQSFHTNFFKPQISSGVFFSHYLHSEGYGSNFQSSKNELLRASNIYSGGPDGKISFRIGTGVRNVVYRYNVTLDNVEYTTGDITGVKNREHDISIPNDDLKNSMRLRVNRLSDDGNVRFGTITLEYPRQFNFDGDSTATIILPEGDNIYLELESFATANGAPIVYVRSQHLRLVSEVEGGITRIAIPASGSSRDIFVFSEGFNIKTVSQLSPVQFKDYTGADPSLVIISHPTLHNSASGTNYVQEYVNYRSSEEGGSYRVGLYSITGLYDQFAFGVKKHPFAIKKFMEWIRTTWSSTELIYIIGKGVEYHNSRIPNGVWEQGFFVPTYGMPGSDNLLVSPPGTAMPDIPVGRLAVVNGDEVGNYLEKVKTFEQNHRLLPQTIEGRAWMKNILHLSGGQDAGQQVQFQNHLENMGSILEESVFGANIFSFSKTNSDPISTPISQQILDIIQNGTSVVNFLGHSSASTLDFQINDPEDWDNAGKYPIFSAMGCSAGLIHSPFRSLSEEFVFADNAGCIAFLAGSGEQFVTPLVLWGTAWYESFGRDDYGTTLGYSILEAYKALSNSSTQQLILIEQQNLNGDPAIKINPQPGPDYITDFSSVKTIPDILTTTLDSFRLLFDIVNLGMLTNDSISIKLTQKLPSGEDIVLPGKKVFADRFRSEVGINVLLQGEKSVGLNYFIIELDKEDVIDELPEPQAELNNILTSQSGQTGYPKFIFENRARTQFPGDFSIVTEIAPELIAGTSNLFFGPVKYIFELDTTRLFNSPAKLTEQIPDVRGTARWKPQFQFEPGSVYYWRVRIEDNEQGQPDIWDYASFLYDPQERNGWNQSHFYQFTQNASRFLVSDSTNFSFQYDKKFKNIRIENEVRFDGSDNPTGFINNTFFSSFFSRYNNTDGNILAMVVDPNTSDIWVNSVDGDYGSINQTGIAIFNYAFSTEEQEGRGNLIHFLENIVPPQHYVILYTYQRGSHMDFLPEQWAEDSISLGTNLFQVIESQYPSSRIRELEQSGSKPYMILYQKDVGIIEEQLANTIESTIKLEYDFPNILGSAYVRTPLIGPAENWEEIVFTHDGSTAEGDTFNVRYIAYPASMSDSIVSVFNSSEETDLNDLNASDYPYLRLEYEAIDTLDRSMPQIQYWRVYYEPSPDFMWNTTNDYLFHADSLYRGDSLHLRANVIRFGGVAEAVTVPVEIRITDPSNEGVSYPGQVIFNAGSMGSIFEFQKYISEPSGDYLLTARLNPDNNPLEQSQNNNIGVEPFVIIRDNISPLLNVTFDGMHIMDGDIVSSKPTIIIGLKDENPHLALDDAALFMVSLMSPTVQEFVPLDVNGPAFLFTPPEDPGENNRAVLEYKPSFTVDGHYKLRVQAVDAEGNPSGDLEYQVGFEVINKRMVSNVFNYPNPFSTSTRFVYTLTGDEIPRQFTIRIMTLSGRIVREITQHELGPLKIGKHMTDYAWDGRDEFGDKLAAGVYLYRVLTQDSEGDSYEHYQTGGDRFFKKDFGKLVIIR